MTLEEMHIHSNPTRPPLPVPLFSLSFHFPPRLPFDLTLSRTQKGSVAWLAFQTLAKTRYGSYTALSTLK